MSPSVADAETDADAKGRLLVSQAMALDNAKSAGRKHGRVGALVTFRGTVDDLPAHLFRLADRFGLDVIHRATERGGLGMETRVELVGEERRKQIADHVERASNDLVFLEQ